MAGEWFSGFHSLAIHSSADFLGLFPIVAAVNGASVQKGGRSFGVSGTRWCASWPTGRGMNGRGMVFRISFPCHSFLCRFSWVVPDCRRSKWRECPQEWKVFWCNRDALVRVLADRQGNEWQGNGFPDFIPLPFIPLPILLGCSRLSPQ